MCLINFEGVCIARMTLEVWSSGPISYPVKSFKARYRPSQPSTRIDDGKGNMYVAVMKAEFTVVARDLPKLRAPGTKSDGLCWR